MKSIMKWKGKARYSNKPFLYYKVKPIDNISDKLVELYFNYAEMIVILNNTI